MALNEPLRADGAAVIPFPSKAAYYTQMAEEAARQVTGSREQWTAFLTTAARLYKYPYNEQLMIYKQRPDATACAEYDLWNKTMRRYVRRGSKGIALVDNTGSRPKLRYVFDVSDTGERENSRPVNLWSMREEYVPAVQDALERAYGVEAGAGLEEQIEKISSQLASGYWDDNKEVILGIVDDSFLYGYDEFNVEVSFRRAAETSIRYMLYSRCVEDPESCFEPEDFMDVFDFNTQAASNVLGTAVSEVSSQVFREVERAIRTYERAKQVEQAEERRQDNGRADLQTGRGLLNLKIVYIYIQPTDTLLADTPQKPNHTEKEFLHMKSIFEQLGGTYHEENGYLIPDLRLPAEKEQPISTWGQRHLHYLKQYRKVTYTNLLIYGKLNIYLADIDKQAQERFERLIEDMKRAQGITERLKEENALEWTGRLGNIRACAREIVNEEIIYA